MGERRGNSTSIIIILMLCMLVFHSKMIYGETYIVGYDQGWHTGVINWPLGKIFYAGDILVFNYDPSKDNVVKVTESGYKTCYPRGIATYRSGADRIPLEKGGNYFISAGRGHCDFEQKIAVIAN
ncbi:basic blue protein-like [Vicia villosa]|uniref:basic blue protein-like n=1 Tax=Vicia villosa TaxID=3911 RepID=UPI00273C35A5|nr:basic blue protein-like [Vicia villosa]